MKCGSSGHNAPLTQLASQVAEFIASRKQTPRDDIDWYRKKTSLRGAIISAANAERNDGGRHSHQWRLERATITEAQKAMLEAEEAIANCTTFDQLHDLIRGLFADIHGAGVLFSYDTTFRLGQFLNLHPTRVYLHAGTRVGARNLGLPASGSFLEMHQLPSELRSMTAADAEDFLCVYKDRFRNPRSGGRPLVC